MERITVGRKNRISKYTPMVRSDQNAVSAEIEIRGWAIQLKELADTYKQKRPDSCQEPGLVILECFAT